MEELSAKHANLLKEVHEMQTFIEELQQAVEHHKQKAEELENVKQGCYSKIKFITEHSKRVEDDDHKSTDEQKKMLENQISEIVAELSDV